MKKGWPEPCLLALLLLVGFQEAVQAQDVAVEFVMYSGRPRPRAEISDAAQAGAILDSLNKRSSLVVPCSEIPPVGSTPLYTGVLLNFTEPVLGQKIMAVREGYISYDISKPCYRDPESNLEKLAVDIAFRYDDMKAPEGPKPMEYLACMVPDSLHPDIAPCETSLSIRRQAPGLFRRRIERLGGEATGVSVLGRVIRHPKPAQLPLLFPNGVP